MTMDSDDVPGKFFAFCMGIISCLVLFVIIGFLATRASDSEVKKLEKRVKHLEHVLEKKE